MLQPEQSDTELPFLLARSASFMCKGVFRHSGLQLPLTVAHLDSLTVFSVLEEALISMWMDFERPRSMPAFAMACSGSRSSRHPTRCLPWAWLLLPLHQLQGSAVSEPFLL